MVFSSVSFVCGFLVIVFALYRVIPSITAKNGLLIVASLAFYSVGEPTWVLLMVGSALFNYLCGLLIVNREKVKKPVLIFCVCVNTGVLVLFKITPLTAIGISFFTFQAMSYVIDVYRGTCPCQRNFFRLLLYISFFPQLIAGPIIKYHDMEAEIAERHQTMDDVYFGIRRFIIGLSKKVLIANTVAMAADALAESPGEIGTGGAWLLAICYALQIYYDFSGYSDMAIGLSRMFGFHFKENFMYPYAADSNKDFWRRWHISLSTWFKEYVYIPLGGNRKGRVRTYVNKYIVFLLTGLWHGVSLNFVTWGLLHGTCSVLEETKLSVQRIRSRVIRTLITFVICVCAFVIFRMEKLSEGLLILRKMFVPAAASVTGSMTCLSCLTPGLLIGLSCGILFMLPWYKGFTEKKRESVLWQGVSGVLCLGVLMLSLLTLASDAYNPFIYFRF